MSIFWSTHEISNETNLPGSVSFTAAVALLHDHLTFQSLQPLLTSNVILTTPPPADSYIVTKSTSLCPTGATPEYRSVTIAVPMGPLSSSMTTTSAMIDTEDGVAVVFQAPMGLYGVNIWKVLKTSAHGPVAGVWEDGLVLREDNELTGPRILMPFVTSTKQRSHEECGLAFVKELEKKNGKYALS